MRPVLLACVPWLLACRALNPAFQDDGGDTTIIGEDSTTSASSGTTGSRPTAPDGSGDAGFTSEDPPLTSTQGPESSSGLYETEGPPELKPFHIPIVFIGRDELYENFVARVQIEVPQLVDVPRQRIGFFDRTSDHPAPFEIIEYAPEQGYLDAWVMLEQWLPQIDTVVELRVGPLAPESENLWQGFEHVWYLDDADLPYDAAGDAQGEFEGYFGGDGLVEGVIARARSFDGDGQHATLQTNLNALNNSPDFAVSAWVFVLALPSGPAPLFGRRGARFDGGPLRIDWAVVIDDVGRVGLRFAGPGDTVSYVPGTVPSQGGWHHFAFVGTADSSYLEIDGQRVAETNLTPTPTLFSSTLHLGGTFVDDPPSGAGFEGAIDHVMWFDEPIPVDWVETIVANHRAPSLLYKLDGVVFD